MATEPVETFSLVDKALATAAMAAAAVLGLLARSLGKKPPHPPEDVSGPVAVLRARIARVENQSVQRDREQGEWLQRVETKVDDLGRDVGRIEGQLDNMPDRIAARIGKA